MKKILVIEDTLEFQKKTKEFFGNKKVDVKYASTLREALDILEAEEIDGVISDFYFPAGDKEVEKKALAYLDKVTPPLEKVISLYEEPYAADKYKKLANQRRPYESDGLFPLGIYIAHVSEKPVVGWTNLGGHGAGDMLIMVWQIKFEGKYRPQTVGQFDATCYYAKEELKIAYLHLMFSLTQPIWERIKNVKDGYFCDPFAREVLDAVEHPEKERGELLFLSGETHLSQEDVESLLQTARGFMQE